MNLNETIQEKCMSLMITPISRIVLCCLSLTAIAAADNAYLIMKAHYGYPGRSAENGGEYEREFKITIPPGVVPVTLDIGGDCMLTVWWDGGNGGTIQDSGPYGGWVTNWNFILGNNGVCTTVTNGGWGANGGSIQASGGYVMFVAIGVGALPDLSGVNSPDKDPCVNCSEHQTAPPQPGTKTADPVRFADGALIMYEDDLGLGGAPGFQFIRGYSNLIGKPDGEFGESWTVRSQPRIIGDGTSGAGASRIVRTEAHRQVAFYRDVDAQYYQPKRSAREILRHAANGDLVFADPTGLTMVFYDVDDANVPASQRGRLKRVYTAGGVPVSTNYNAAGKVTEQTRTLVDSADNDLLVFTYDQANGRMQTAERRRISGGVATVIAKAEYGLDPGTRQLRSVTVKDGAGQVLRRFHYRYYRPGEADGYPGLMKHAVGPRTYARMVQQSIDPETATDTVIAQWADKSFKYDSSRRVTQQILRTPDVDGSGTYNYAYTPRSSPPVTPAPNDWMMQFVETLPDGGTNTAFTNEAGDVIFRKTANAAGTVLFAEAWHFDAQWRATWHFTPAAMQAVGGVWFDANNTDLIGKVPAQGAWDSGNAPFVRDDAGLIERWTYDTTSGQVQTYRQQVGETGEPKLIKKYTYVGHSAP